MEKVSHAIKNNLCKANYTLDTGCDYADLSRALEIVNYAEKNATETDYNWIPCIERLPNQEYEQELLLNGKDAAYPVFVTAKNKNGQVFTTKVWFFELFLERNFYDSETQPLDVVAWMPAAPYKGE